MLRTGKNFSQWLNFKLLYRLKCFLPTQVITPWQFLLQLQQMLNPRLCRGVSGEQVTQEIASKGIHNQQWLKRRVASHRHLTHTASGVEMKRNWEVYESAEHFPSGGDNHLKSLAELAFHPLECSKHIGLLTGLLRMKFLRSHFFIMIIMAERGGLK